MLILLCINVKSQNYIKKYHQPSIKAFQYLIDGKYAKSEKIFQKITDKYDPFCEELYALAYLKMKKGDIESAKVLIYKSIDRGLNYDSFFERDSTLFISSMGLDEYHNFSDSVLNYTIQFIKKSNLKYEYYFRPIKNTEILYQASSANQVASIKDTTSAEYKEIYERFRYAMQLNSDTIQYFIDNYGLPNGRIPNMASYFHIMVVHSFIKHEKSFMNHLTKEYKNGVLTAYTYATLHERYLINVEAVNNYFIEFRNITDLDITPDFIQNRHKIGIGNDAVLKWKMPHFTFR